MRIATKIRNIPLRREEIWVILKISRRSNLPVGSDTGVYWPGTRTSKKGVEKKRTLERQYLFKYTPRPYQGYYEDLKKSPHIYEFPFI
jgi:hypothetical protein